MCYENRLPGTIYFGGNSPISRRAVEGEREEVFCPEVAGGRGGRVERLTGRQKARTRDPPTCGGGLPTQRLPVFWPLPPRSEPLGVRGLRNCLGVTDGILREDFTASQRKTPKSWELQGVFSYWLNNPQHESRSTRFLLSCDLCRT